MIIISIVIVPHHRHQHHHIIIIIPGVNEVVRGVLLPWFNTFRFFAQCVDRWEAISGRPFIPDNTQSKASTNDVDVWILAASFGLVDYVHQEMKAYRLYTVVPRLVEFIDELTKW